MQVAVFHPGTQHSWQTASALQQLGRLEWYATSIFHQPDRFPYWLERIAPGPIGRRLQAEFRRFSHAGLDPGLVRTVGLAEWLERIATRAGWHRLARSLDTIGNRRFASGIGRALRSQRRFALWGYSGSALASFELARARGRPCVLDRTIGDSRVFNQLMAQVAETHGDWFLPTERAVPVARIANDQREYEAADVIVTGSDFAANTVRDTAGPEVAAKIRVLPYCFDPALFGQAPEPQPLAPGEPVRLLYVGQMNPRKGIHHVLEAVARIPRSQAELTVVGGFGIPRKVFAPHADRVTYLPTVARADMPAIMARHHLLVFPSYFEGSALSLLEALASGLAIIQTPNSGLGVTPETGLLLERPHTDLLHAALLEALSDRDRLLAWRRAAQVEARGYTFARYRDNIAALLADMGI